MGHPVPLNSPNLPLPIPTLIRNKCNVRRHFRLRHFAAGYEDRYRCPMCGQVLRQKFYFMDHVYKTHPDVKGLDYDKCKL